MDGIVICLGRSRNRRFKKKARTAEDPKLAKRYLMIVNLDEGRSVSDTARALDVAESTVRRVRQRFAEHAEAGLVDRREENGETKLGEQFLATLYDVVAGSPEDYGFPRPTWTREMLAITLRKQTGVKIHVSTMSRALKAIGARRGRPKPTVGCPWSKRAKNRKLRAIEDLVANLPVDEVAVYEDNYSIHSTEQVHLSLETPEGQRLELHFLPPYCPDHNKIERTWQDLHANVTRNHTRKDMASLMKNVRRYMKRRNRELQQDNATAA